MGRLAVLGGVVRTMLREQTDAGKQVPDVLYFHLLNLAIALLGHF